MNWLQRWWRVRSRSAPSADARTSASRESQRVDPVRTLRSLPVFDGFARALAGLESSEYGLDTGEVLAWVRTTLESGALPAQSVLRWADLLVSRGDDDEAIRYLCGLESAVDSAALSARWSRAAILERRGDGSGARRLREQVLAYDVAFPGAIERLANTADAPLGSAGATLLAPDGADVSARRWRLVRELGRGGAGAVFLAREDSAGREVALKIYHPSRRAERVERLRVEARVAAALASRHVVRIVDLDEKLGAISMEHCASGTLVRASGAAGPGFETAVFARLRDVARALAITHAAGWIHGDVKPGNILVRSDGEAVLSDFGLARRVGSPIRPGEGTEGFTAPELRNAAIADPRIDVFALGATARAMSQGASGALHALAARCMLSDLGQRPADGAAALRVIESAMRSHVARS